MSQSDFPGPQPPSDPSSPYASPLSQSAFPGPQAVYKDRTVGLVLFGILEILLGGLCALLVPLIALSMVMAAQRVTPTDPRMMIPGMMVYVVMAVVLIWLGIGSVRCRRWARALSLVLAWLWLVIGIAAMAFCIVLMPGMYEAMGQQGKAPPREFLLVVETITFGMLGCIYVVLPGALVLFYQSRHVRATCEAKDPQVRWTDRCPLPVLAVSVGWAATAFFSPWAFCYGAVLPLFGTLVTGFPAGLVILAGTAIAGCLAWGTYRLKMFAWWGSIAVVVLWTASVAVTFSRIGLMDFYRAMHMPPEQLKMIQQTGMVERVDALMPWLPSLAALAMVGYLLFTKRYFARAAAEG